MTDPIAVASRAAAERLADSYPPGLVAEVEAVLYGRSSGRKLQQYTDLISVSSLIVSIATLAWTVYSDLKKDTPKPSPGVVVNTVLTEFPDHSMYMPEPQERIVNIVVVEIINAAGDS